MKNKKQILWRIGITNTFLMKRLCLTLKIALFKWLLRQTIFDPFKTAVDKAIRRYAPIKKRYFWANQAPFIYKKINKEIAKRPRLRYKFLNTKSDIDRKAHNKQRNLCVSLIRSEKKNFSNINTCDITDNKTFWKTVKPFFTDQIKTKCKITLIEKKTSPRKVKRK